MNRPANNMVKNAFGPVAANAVNNSLKNTGNALKNTGNAVANAANGNFAAAANNVAVAANNAVAAATNGVNAAVNGAVNVANGAVNASKNALFGLPTAVGNAATAVGNTAKSAVNKMTNVVSNVGNTLGFTNNANANANSGNKNNSTNANKGNNIVLNAANNALNAVSEGPGFFGSIWVWILIILLFAVGVFVFFYDQIMAVLPESVQSAFDRFKEAIGIPVEKPVALPEPVPVAPVSASIIPLVPVVDASGAGATATAAGTGLSGLAGNLAGIINKQLPAQKKEVFNVKENKYKYEDAEPLCKALGAELATYDQVKDAYDAGADWCNYGWIKGQRAVYPTQESTYEKLQQGPVGQRQACGKPGVNGGYFDNPELRFGVNCYGTKPAQKGHDTTLLPNGEANPFSPDALEFDRRVAEFKADSANIGILPFKEGAWDEA